MNIGFICNELPPASTGGIGTFVTELTNGLNAAGHRVHIVSLDFSGHKTSAEAVSRELTIHRVRAGRGRFHGYLNRFKLFSRIRELASRGQIDVIEVPDFEGWCAGWPQLPISVVVRLHGSISYFAAEMNTSVASAVKHLERLALQRADHVVSVSYYATNRTKEVFELPLWPTVIYNSVVWPDTAHIKTHFGASDLVCYSGTLVEKKGVFSLARAWRLVKQRRPKARLLMIGRDGGHEGGSAIDRIRQLAGEFSDSIEFTGHLPKLELERLLTGADVAVFPSYSETFALAPMEAMALGVPTIYTTRAAGPELMRHNIDGLMCDPDDVEALADQIVTVLESESLRCRLGRAGRRRIGERYSFEESLRNNIEFYSMASASPAKFVRESTAR
jgi:glycogen synthase